MRETTLHSFDAVKDSVESLFADQGRPHAWLFWIIVVLALAGLMVLPLVRVDQSVGAPGLVRPSIERIAVQTAVDGIVVELHVRENQQVKHGDILLVLQSRVLEEKIAYNRAQQAEIADRLSDLGLMISSVAGMADMDAPPSTAGAGVETSSPAVPSNRFRTAAYLRQYEYFLSQLETSALQSAKAEREHTRLRSLHERGLAPDQDFEQSRYVRENTLIERRQLLRQNLSQWQSDRLERDALQASLQAEARQLAEQKALYVIRAPADGTAIGFAGLSVGAYLPAAARLGEISPTAPLLIEAQVTSKDIGFIHPGQSARIQIAAFPYSQWGTLTAVVREISPDLVLSGQQASFKVLLRMQGARLHARSGATVEVGKGMTANVRFIVAERSLLELLYQSLTESLDPVSRSP